MNTSTLSWHDLQWCLRRAPRPLLELLKRHGSKVMVAGGYIRSCISNEHINDIDVFTSSEEQSKALALELVEGDEKRMKRTPNCYFVLGFRTHIQFIHRWTFTDPAACILSFDFTIARAAFWWEKKMVPAPTDENAAAERDDGAWKTAADPRFYQDLAAKRLIYCSPVRIEEAGGSMLRVLKFYQRGFRIPLDSLGKVIARLVGGVNEDSYATRDEAQMGKVLSGLLREVDPNIDPSHIAHLPSEPEDESQEPTDGHP
jgi:hypothetical protein